MDFKQTFVLIDVFANLELPFLSWHFGDIQEVLSPA
jgi:hypothetical protein